MSLNPESFPDSDWDLSREFADEYADWRYAVSNEDTLSGFRDWLTANGTGHAPDFVFGDHIDTDGAQRVGTIQATVAELTHAFGDSGVWLVIGDDNVSSGVGVCWSIEFTGSGDVACISGHGPDDEDTVAEWRVSGFNDGVVGLIQKVLTAAREA